MHESTYTAIGDITLITSQNRDQNTTFFYDVDLKENHVYEYSAKLTFKSGITQIFGSAVVEYISFVEGIDTRITDVSITNGIKPDVSFNLLTLIAKSGLDDVAAMLEAQNLKSYFDNDILNERDKLQQLIAHNVVRVNLSEGIREDFGVVTDSLFVDSNFRKRCAAADIDARNIYRYEVTALLRTPETLFEDFVKNKTDPISGKQFSMKPSKFNHPIALSRGNITSPESLKARYGKKPMMFGRVGNVEAVEIAFTRPSVTLSNATAVMSNAKTVSVVWTMSGSPGIVDHFMIVSIVNGVRRIVGTTHPYSSALEGRFIHVLTPADKGYAHYAIVPVLNDYTQLSETLTNNLLIQ